MDANQREFTWEILVNDADYPLNGVRLVDYLPEGLTIADLVTDVIVTGENAGDVIKNFDEVTRLLTLNFGDISNTYTVEVTTQITDEYLQSIETKGNRFSKLDFDNTATLYQTIVEDGVPVEKSVTDDAKIEDLKFGKILYKKGTASIGYNDQKFITWSLDVNLGELETGNWN